MGHPFLLGPPQIRLPPTPPNPNPAILDFFFHINPNTPPKDLTHRLYLAWKHDPLTTLKLICSLRYVKTNAGKSNMEVFYTAGIWLHQNHPLTLSCNVAVLIGFEYSKDLLEIVYRLVESEGEENIENGRERNGVDRARRAIEKYFCDPNYRLLHDQLSEGLAELLRSDVKFLNSGEKRKISLASKWCPSIDSSYDKSTLICENIARKVFPRDSDSQYDGLEEAHYAYRVRNRLHKEVLIPLRKEIHTSEEKCNRVAFNTMKAYKTYKNLYGECDEEMLYQHYFEVVHECGKATIGEGLKLPHQIITSCLKEESESPEVAELQWGRLVEEFSNKGKFKNSLAVCDLSKNMRGSLMEDVCIAMGLLVSELNGPPWKGKVFSFSDYPKLRNIRGDDLLSKIEFMGQLECGENIDFQKVYDRILQVAIEHKLSKDKMVKRIFVFSSMEFEVAAKNVWETDYRAAWKSYRNRGYKTVPEIVFWNLKANSIASPVVYSSPVDDRHKGLSLMAGFSKSMLCVFLEGDGVVKLEDVKKLALVPEPEDVMKSAISGEEYQNLIVFD